MDERNIRLRHLLEAARDLGQLIGSGEAQLDKDGYPIAGSPTARIMMIVALYQPQHRARPPSKN